MNLGLNGKTKVGPTRIVVRLKGDTAQQYVGTTARYGVGQDLTSDEYVLVKIRTSGFNIVYVHKRRQSTV